MTAFVLIHGAFRGGWAWSRVRPLLEVAGHQVHAPSLLGCGELAPQAAAVTGLDVWVDQVVQLLDHEDLDDVVLVGHSQGGVITTAVAALAPKRLEELAYLDAAVPRPGERAVDVGPGAPTQLPPRETLIPATPIEGDPWTTARLTPTPLAPSLDPMPVPTEVVPARYAFCSGTPDGYPSRTTRDRLDADGTPYDVIDAGHDAPLTAPEAVAAWLMEERQ